MWGSIYQVNGMVTRVDDGGVEPADRDWFKSVLKLLLVPFIGSFLLIWWLLTRRSPLRGLMYGFLIFGRGHNMVPVEYFRVRDSSMNEYIIRRKGYMDSNVATGDHVEVLGHMHNSVLHLSSGRNLTTGAPFKVKKR